MTHIRLCTALAAAMLLLPAGLRADDGNEASSLPAIDATIGANFSTGKFAPYFMSSMTHGKVFQKNSAYADVRAVKAMDYGKRFSWGAGAEVIGSFANATTYDRWQTDGTGAGAWAPNSRRPNSFTLQQLYAEAKYRAVFIEAGMRERGSALLNQELSSGDLVESGNARPIPQVRLGFHRFVDIPFTQGWVQIQGELAYGIMTDYGFLADRYNYYNDHINKGAYYNYKRCYLRTKPTERFVVTVGMQGAGLFGGTTRYYNQGRVIRTDHYDTDFKSLFNMMFPFFNGKETFAEGSNLGSWDLFAHYRLNNGDKVCAYIQWPFEDGSGIGRRNKGDGVWGIEYKGKPGGIVSGAVLEYIDFRDQSGPIHYAPGDHPGSTITTEATGRDNYYNNGFYNAYANYGMAIGTPFLISPIYNLDGSLGFMCNRANGVHAGINGTLPGNVEYRALFGYQRGMGTYANPYPEVRTNTSVMLEAKYKFASRFIVKAQVEIDRGKLRGNNFGALATISYKIM